MKGSPKIWVVPLALAGVIATCSRGEAVQDTTAAAAAADFIFSGTVLRPHAATIELDHATDYALVRVDRILVGGRAFRQFARRAITVRLRQAAIRRTSPISRKA